VNPAAGAGKSARRWPQIANLLRNIGLKFDHHLTEAPGHASKLAGDAARQGCEFIVAVGGDGTIHEIVNGLYHTGDISNITLGIIGTGTGSDYIRTLGIPHRYMEACHCLLNPRTTLVDLGVVEYTSKGKQEQRIFTNFAGIGFAAEIVRMTRQKFKSLGATPSYLMGLLTTLISYRNSNVTVKYNDTVEEKKLCLVTMNHGRYAGGKMMIAPEADISDGLFDMIFVNDLNKFDLIYSLPRIYRGTHLTHSKVSMVRTDRVEISSAFPLALQADGELLGEIPASFSVLPAALKISV
jgi:YegS/Rv2252/BmrU family lipid kinase